MNENEKEKKWKQGSEQWKEGNTKAVVSTLLLLRITTHTFLHFLKAESSSNILRKS